MKMNKERVYVCNLGLSEETYKVIIDYIEEKNLGIIQERTVEEWDLSELYQISASDICILLLTEKAVQDSMLYKKLSIIWEYINKEHVSVLPIASGNQSYIEKLPSGLSSLHILNLKDPLLIEKVCRFFVTQSSFSGIRSDIMQVESCLQTGKISNCSAKQLFNYALGLLYGIEVDKDLKHALIVLCCLVGNDAFEPDFIHFNPDRASRAGLAKELMSFSNELMVYLDHRIDAINETQDYRDFETLIDYAALVQRIGKSLYGWNADESLRKLRDVVSLFFSKDHSVIAGRWLMNYYWERALREADGGYYRKALDCIMEIVIVGEDIEQKHNDPQVQILLFKCYSVLAHYFMCRRSMIEELIERKITDKVIDNGTFKPEYREIRRKPEDRALLNRLVRNSKMLCYQKIDEIMKDGIGLEQYKYLLSEVLNAG